MAQTSESMRFEFMDGHFDCPKNCPILFGILNVTPDSFFDGGRFHSAEEAVGRGLQLEADGADALDIGGESTRPGSKPVAAREEMNRILPVIRALASRLRIPVSVDTSKADVAEAALAAGARIINDVSGLSGDPAMARLAATSGAGVILMHMRGTPQTMQTRCHYHDVVQEVQQELCRKIEAALAAGIGPGRLAIDPGIGFAKTQDQNLALLQHLKTFTDLGTPGSPKRYPVMIGVSRKSFLGGDVATRGPATLTAELKAASQGVHMIRTHGVAGLRRALEAQRSTVQDVTG